MTTNIVHKDSLKQDLNVGDTVIGSYQGTYKGVFVGKIIDTKKKIKVRLYKEQTNYGGHTRPKQDFWTEASYLVKINPDTLEVKLVFED